MAKLTKEQNDALFVRLTAMGSANLHRVIICDKWDTLNSRYEKYGCDSEFALLRRELKQMLKRYTDVDAARLSAENPDVRVLVNKKTREYKVIHGYNFNYPSAV